MKSAIVGLLISLLLLMSSANAVPFHYKFNGTVQQTVFDPDNPFAHPVGPDAAIVGRVLFDTAAPDQVADPRVGVYSFAGSPFFLSLELHDGGGQTGFSFDTFTLGVVDGMPDQYTLHAERGDPDTLDGYTTFDMVIEYPPFRLASDDLPAIPPAIDAPFLHTFALRGATMLNGQLYQYELLGTVDSIGVPAPGSLCLLAAGGLAMAVLRRRAAFPLLKTVNRTKENLMAIPALIRSLAAAACVFAAALPGIARAVDGVVLITQARALAGGVTPGDGPGFPVTISERGSYRLASDLRVPSPGVSAIELVTNNIELDLNGFTIFGPGKGNGSAAGIEGFPGGGATGATVTIRNGFVREMGGHGISIDSTTTVDHVASVENGLDGMILTTGSRITNSQANSNGRHGFRILIGQIANSNATANGQSGIYVEYGTSLISDNVLERNGAWGIQANTAAFGGPTAYKGNVMFGNALGTVTGTAVELGPNLCNGTTSCP